MALYATLMTGLGAAVAAGPPAPYGVVPAERHLLWHEMEVYGLIHFGPNTFTDQEWGYGDVPAETFDPSKFDAEQIVETCADAGLRGLILVCKHHDGFCLWPTKTTDYSIAASPWRDGKGDMVREFADACREYGLKFGTYLSPWDRNHAEYGEPAYVDAYREQLRELMTGYGPLFEVWFDGANGGDGYYGGARETRGIDRTTYYGWETTWGIVRELQPNACMFSDVGPDVRWVGNEAGHAGDPCWATYTPRGRDGAEACPGQTQYHEGENGHRDSEFWLPAEVDVPLRPGWFYHASHDGRTRAPENLLQLYMKSVGRGASLNLGLAPDRRGLLEAGDVESLRAFGAILRETFGINLAEGARASASSERGKDFDASNVLNRESGAYWCAEDGATHAQITLRLPEVTTFDVVSIREHLPLGQRVDDWALDRYDDGRWVQFADGTAIGARCLWHGPVQTTDRVRLRIFSASACPAISEVALHRLPENVFLPLDPSDYSRGYTSDIAKDGWRIHGVSDEDPNNPARQAIDGREDTIWASDWQGDVPQPHSLSVDLGADVALTGFTLLPRPPVCMDSVMLEYEFHVSADGRTWGEPVAKGTFENLENNPVEQTVWFDEPASGRYIRITSLRALGDQPSASLAELGVLTRPKP